MKKYLKTTFVDRREGLITSVGSLVYLAVWSVHKFAPAYSPVPWFYGMLSLYIPLALTLTYAKMGGFTKDRFESSAFGTGILLFILIIPFIVAAKSAMRL